MLRGRACGQMRSSRHCIGLHGGPGLLVTPQAGLTHQTSMKEDLTKTVSVNDRPKALSDFVLGVLSRPLMARWSPIPLRLIVGYGFMQHGFAKLSRGPDSFAAILQGMGVPAPHLMAWLTILTELLGGLAVLLGAFVTIVSVPMTAVLLVAMFKVHLQYGFSSIRLLAVTATGAKFGPVG